MRGKIKVCLIILAAGKSKRMGFSKAFLLKNRTPFILLHLKNFKFCEKKFVITGIYHDAIKKFLDFELKEKNTVFIIYNKFHEKGQFSSIKTGLAAIKNFAESCEGAFILPVDVPPFENFDFKSITKKFLNNNEKKIFVLGYNNTPGHPVFVKSSLFDEMLLFNKTLRDFIKIHEKETLFFNTKKKEAIININTPLDYENYIKFLKGGKNE